jgi:heme A synthase
MNLLIGLLILALIAGIVWWGIQQIPLPPPLKNIFLVVFMIILVLILAGVLTGHWSFPVVVR